MSRIGLVTIGQSPRDDVVPEICEFLPRGVEVVQIGALDGLTTQEIVAHRPKSEKRTLVTRLATGHEVSVDADFIHERVQRAIKTLEQKVDLVGLLCSASFPGFSSRVPLILPGRLLEGFLQSLFLPGPIGVLVPSSAQVGPVVDEIQALGVAAMGAAVSPYSEGDRVVRAAQLLVEQGAAVLLLHCFGYSGALKRQIQLVTGKPVILVRSLFARVLAELV